MPKEAILQQRMTVMGYMLTKMVTYSDQITESLLQQMLSQFEDTDNSSEESDSEERLLVFKDLQG